MSKSKKTLHYRNAQITKTQETLQSLLSKAFSNEELSVADNRRENFNKNSEEFRIINELKENSSLLFGQLVYVSPEQAQTVLNMEKGAKTYTINPIDINSMGNENNKKIRQEFVNSLLYFLSYKNHLVILQSKALSTRDLETYIFWFLSKAKLLQNESTVILQNQPPKETIELINKRPVKKVKIGTPLSFNDDDENLEDNVNPITEVTQTKMVKVKNAIGIDILKTIMPTSFFQNQNFDACLDDANLQVNLEIFYSRKTTEKGQAFIDTIATSLRHAHEDDVQINLSDGGSIKGNKLQLSTSISVETKDGLIDETNLFKQMQDWLLQQMENEEIDS